MLATILNFIVTFYQKSIEPAIVKVVRAAMSFIEYVGVDNNKAADYAIEAFVAFAASLIVFIVLAKSLMGLSEALQSFGSLLKSVKSLFVQLGSFFKSKGTNLIISVTNLLLSTAFYRGIIDWCAMIDHVTARRLATAYEDGSTHLRSQRNKGIAVLAVAIWSSGAFGYGIYAAGKSFNDLPDALLVIGVMGAFLYGVLILCLDRSIVAPFSGATFRGTIASIYSGPFSKITAAIAIFPFLFPVFKFAARVVIAFYIAKFTALPLTMLILHGGIVEAQSSSNVESRRPIETRIQEIGDNRSQFIIEKANSTQCSVATTAVAAAEKAVEDILRQPCRDGRTPCEKQGTITAKKYLNEVAIPNKNTVCNASKTELDSFQSQLDTAQDELRRLPDATFPDILSGAKSLEKLAEPEFSGAYQLFSPVKSTYYVLLTIELIPVFMKLWQPPFTNRRHKPDRRLLPFTSVLPPPPTTRRTGDRRVQHLRLEF
jgi:hypothetical protein